MYRYYIYEYGLNHKIIKTFNNNKKALAAYENMDQSKYGFEYKYIHPKRLYKEVFNNLCNGLTYSDGFYGFKIINDTIIYNHYGSSGVSVSLKSVIWLLENIFMDDFYKLKLCKNGYVNMI